MCKTTNKKTGHMAERLWNINIGWIMVMDVKSKVAKASLGCNLGNFKV
jgi:hypothetical protein